MVNIGWLFEKMERVPLGIEDKNDLLGRVPGIAWEDICKEGNRLVKRQHC